MGTQDKTVWSPGWREDQLASLEDEQVWDLIIVGGGITGAGVYREAVHRGLKVLLVEQQDFAWGTSSRSSKMVHGGLRYLGSGQFGLANDSVKERQHLMNELPGLVDHLPFLMGHYKGMFPGPWIFDKLLAIYDWMAGKRYRSYRNKGIRDYWVPGVNASNLKGMTQFADAVTDDARLVMRVLHEANAEGGVALNYVRAKDTLRDNGKVNGLIVEDLNTGSDYRLKAKAVVNATGAWTDTLRASLGHHKVIRPLRGSHLIIPFWRLPVAFSVSFFHPKDKRPVFVFPWEGTTVIGTTDLDHQDDMAKEASITEQEVMYLLEAANQQFSEANIKESDVLSTWSGVRPVVSKNQDAEVDLSKPSDEKREHAIWDDNGLISVAGGKLTTYRLIALDALEKTRPYLKNALGQQTFETPTPFSQIDASEININRRLIGRFGNFAKAISLINSALKEKQNRKVGPTDTLWAELIWSCQNESVVHLDDLLLRRSRLGLLLRDGASEYMAEIKQICQQHLDWDDARWESERDRYQEIIHQHYSLPSKRRGDRA